MLQSELTVSTCAHGPRADQICQSFKRKWKSGRVVAEREALEPACPGNVAGVTLGKLPSLPATVSPADRGSLNTTYHRQLPRGPDEFSAYKTLKVQGTVGTQSR